MKIPIYHIDAFSSKAFAGNPAGVCPLESWLDDSLLQAIAYENNLSETAFFVPAEKGYHIRWFSPIAEVDLCGHATLATAFVIFNCLPGSMLQSSASSPVSGPRGISDSASSSVSGSTSGNEIIFFSKSGVLKVTRQQDHTTMQEGGGEDLTQQVQGGLQSGLLSMDFPSRTPLPCNAPEDLLEGLQRKPERSAGSGPGVPKPEPLEVLCSEDYFVVFRSESDIMSLTPDMKKLRKLGLRGVIVTAKGDEADFVSRFFAPRLGIDEDPVTGSAHCALIPYWAEKLGRQNLYARQLSARGGELYCTDRGERVVISGRAVKYMEGTITLSR
ncbi:MAG: PhzF family phenazine biosynthesis protein [bacterium]